MAWKLVNPNITNDPSYLDPRLSDDESKISSNTTSLAQKVNQSDAHWVIPQLQTGETYWDAAINRAIQTANTQNKKVLLLQYYDVNAPIYLYNNTVITGANNACGIKAHQTGATILKNTTDSQVSNVTLEGFKISVTDANGIGVDMNNISYSFLKGLIFDNGSGSQNKTGIRFQGLGYYNNVIGCEIGGFNIGILCTALANTGANEINIEGSAFPSCVTGVQTTSLSNEFTNMVRVQNCSLESNTTGINFDGRYNYAIRNRYENSQTGVILSANSVNCEVVGGLFYGTTTPIQDNGKTNRVIFQSDLNHIAPVNKYGIAFNYLLNPDFDNISGGVPENWVATGLTASIDTSFVSGLRLLKLIIPASTTGTIYFTQHLTNILNYLLGNKYAKAVIYNDSTEISNIRLSINGSTGLQQSGGYNGVGWRNMLLSSSLTSVPTWCDFQISATANTTVERHIYIAFIGLTDNYIGDIEISKFHPYVNKFGGRMEQNLNFYGGYNTSHIVLGTNHIWVDSTGKLRIKNGVPSSDTDGVTVGSQT